VEKVKSGYTIDGKKFKVHLDGYNLLPFLSGKEKESPRKGFIYWSDDGDMMALRAGNWKVHFVEQRAHGLGVWKDPLVVLRVPTLINLRSDPFERAPEDASVFAISGRQIGCSCLYRCRQLYPVSQDIQGFLQEQKLQVSVSTRPWKN
jgi:arylsulfatase